MASRDIYSNSFDEVVQQSDQNTWPESSGLVTTNAPETVCDDCGLVIKDEQLNHGPEGREFENDWTSNHRARSPNTIIHHDRGIGSEISWDRNRNGQQLDERKQRHVARLRREHTRARPPRRPNGTASKVSMRSAG